MFSRFFRLVWGGDVDPALRPVLAVSLFGSIAGSSAYPFMGIWAIKHLGAPQSRLAFTYLIGAVLAGVMGYAAGHWSDRVGRRPLILAGWGFQAVVPLLLLGVGQAAPGRFDDGPQAGQRPGDQVRLAGCVLGALPPFDPRPLDLAQVGFNGRQLALQVARPLPPAQALQFQAANLGSLLGQQALVLADRAGQAIRDRLGLAGRRLQPGQLPGLRRLGDQGRGALARRVVQARDSQS